MALKSSTIRVSKNPTAAANRQAEIWARNSASSENFDFIKLLGYLGSMLNLGWRKAKDFFQLSKRRGELRTIYHTLFSRFRKPEFLLSIIFIIRSKASVKFSSLVSTTIASSAMDSGESARVMSRRSRKFISSSVFS